MNFSAMPASRYDSTTKENGRVTRTRPFDNQKQCFYGDGTKVHAIVPEKASRVCELHHKRLSAPESQEKLKVAVPDAWVAEVKLPLPV
jgi:hypothetical protein